MSQHVVVTLPDIGEGVVEGEIIAWLKQEGEHVEQDEPLVIVMTDKATVELPASYPGVLVKQHYQPGEPAIVDKPLYTIAVADKKISNKSEKTPQKVSPFIAEERKSTSVARKKALATPATRKAAREMGIDIDQVAGSGKGGRVTVDDLKKYQKSPSSEEETTLHLPGDQRKPLMGVQRLMAKKMSQSKRTIPHFSYHEIIDATRLIQLKQSICKEGEKEGMHITYTPFLIRALSLTIHAFPLLNSALDLAADTLILHKQHNVGIAVSTDLGLIVPVLKNVEEMSLEEIIRAFAALKEKVLARQLKRQDMKEGTITISNFGVFGSGGMWATPIINSPEVAILAVNKIQKQPHVINDELVILNTMNASWSFDHRVIDGDTAARISNHFAALIQNPALLL